MADEQDSQNPLSAPQAECSLRGKMQLKTGDCLVFVTCVGCVMIATWLCSIAVNWEVKRSDQMHGTTNSERWFPTLSLVFPTLLMLVAGLIYWKKCDREPL